MTTIKPVESIDKGLEVYYCGWSEAEIIDLKTSYQSKFEGLPDDLKLEIITDDNQLYFIRFRSGNDEFALTTQYQFLLIEEKSGLIVNANGAIHRFDIAEKKCLSTEYYTEGIRSTILSTSISPKLGVMIVIDWHGISAISWDTVLWRKDFKYAEEIKIPLEIDTIIPVEYSPPDSGNQFFKLDVLTGDIIK